MPTQDNIYWLFSSSAQAIAAFTGFISAGFFFVNDKMNNQIIDDESLLDIYSPLQAKYYKNIRVLLILTGCSIIFSLLAVYLNGFDMTCLMILIYIIVSALNVITIVWGIYFVIEIINPNKISIGIKNIKKKNRTLFETNKETVAVADFLQRFLNLERILKQTAIGNDMSIYDNHTPLVKFVEFLSYMKIITPVEYNDILTVIKVRNIAKHEQIISINKPVSDLLNDLIDRFQE